MVEASILIVLLGLTASQVPEVKSQNLLKERVEKNANQKNRYSEQMAETKNLSSP